MLLLYLLGLATTALANESISAALADPSFVPYAVPKQKIEEFIALGDSYTAGTGCNGNNEIIAGDAVRGKRSYPMQMSQDKDNWGFVNHGDEDLPRFSFHAYTGDTSVELVSQQLKQGDYKDDKDLPRGQPFGKPQVAVMTIGGNDAHLSTILNDCIYRAWRPGNCDDTLNNLQKEIDDGSLREKINVALYNVADAGRKAGGANPRESFQTFVLEYITFFDDAMSPECNEYTWTYWGWYSTPKLDKPLRERLNDLTLKVNKVIKDAAKDLERMGVIFIEGLQDTYKGHRYCEPGANKEQTEAKVWFWSPYAHFNTPSEGAGDPNNAEAKDYVDPGQQLLDFVFPGQNKVATQSADQPPWDWEGADKYPDFQSLLNAIAASAPSGDASTQDVVPFPLMRSFHPKATAYKEHATLFFAAMADNREATASGGGDDPGQGQNQPDQGLKCFGIDNTKFMGRDDMNDKLTKFCSEAAKQGVQDKDSGSIMRKYNGDNQWEVNISMDWPPGTDITQNMESKCVEKMTTIMDSCDGNDPKNPRNWKHGGTLGDGVVKYGIYPQKDQGWKPGQCSFKLHQHEDFFGDDGPGTRRDHTYYVEQLQIFGGDGTELVGRAGYKPNSGDADPIECGDGNPFRWGTALPDKMEITPEARDDYIQFTIGPISWKSSDTEGDKKCKVDDWDTQYDPVFGEFSPTSGSQDRNMECWFPC